MEGIYGEVAQPNEQNLKERLIGSEQACLRTGEPVILRERLGPNS